MIEKGPNLGSRKEALQAPDLELRGEVLGKLEGRMRIFNWLKENEKLDPSEVFVRSVAGEFAGRMKTETVLQEVGLPSVFPAIFIASKQQKPLAEDIIAYEVDPRSSTLFLDLEPLFPKGMIVDEIALLHTGGTNPSAFRVLDTGEEIYLGKVQGGCEESVLVIKDMGGGSFETLSLTLPRDWKSIFSEDGKLIEEPIGKVEEVATPTILPAVAPQAPKEAISKIFSKMLELVKNFPEYDGYGVINKKGIRVAQFGEAGTPVEIKIEDGKITLDFSGLDLDKLKKVCEKGELALSTFSNCFGKEGCDRLVLEVLSKGDWTVQFKGKIVRWDAGRVGLVDSLPYFGPYFPAECKRELQGFISELATADFLLSQLNQPKLIPTRIHSTRYPPPDYGAQSNRLPMGGHGVSAHHGGDKVQRFYERDPQQIQREKKAYREKAVKRKNDKRREERPSKSKRRR